LINVASLLGYSPRRTAAVRSTNHYYNVTSEIHDRHADFWYNQCGLPKSFQAWFQITNLHIYLLTVRFRGLPSPIGRNFTQELINHFFIDSEYRMQSPNYYNVKQQRAVKAHMQDLLSQHHGSIMAFDEALINSDTVLASALWRNLFGAAWGKGMGGVTGSKAPEPENPLVAAANKDEASLTPQQEIEREANFATNLEQMVVWFRKETFRLDSLSDEAVIYALAMNEQGDGSAVDWSKPGPEAEESVQDEQEGQEKPDPLQKGSDGKDAFERATEKGPAVPAQEEANQPAVWS